MSRPDLGWKIGGPSHRDHVQHNGFDEDGRLRAFIHTMDAGETWILVGEEGSERTVLGAFMSVAAAKTYWKK